ncbi:MAG TPA: Gfo/Idh/MocA family oxidoreductase [Terriglobia bacterium]|jgi:predicted dehydrogenase|nr:Gfo/Idh/MocA family oxidoreductase [Terriglobia bacterium]
MADDSHMTRRDFLKSGAGTTAGLALGGTGLGGATAGGPPPSARSATAGRPGRVRGANDRVRLAVCGVRGRGWDHIEGFAKIPEAEIVALCDIDQNVLHKRLADMAQRNLGQPSTYTDVRKLLDEKSIDAISIATPNHWHSLMAIWACQAGKDVYCEKPCCHNAWEGAQLVEAVKKYNRIVQHGTQSRSASAIREAVDHLRNGTIGDVYLARALCYKWRDTIGHAAESPVPAGVDYDLWTGPAPLKPFTKNRFHYNWHWIWDTGNGDIGNQGVHEMDIARWGLGLRWPSKASAVGGHFMFDDDQQTPNTLNCAFEYDLGGGKRQMLEFEVRHWMTNHESEIGTSAFGSEGVPQAGLTAHKEMFGGSDTIGNLFYGSQGYLAIDGYDSYRIWLGRKQEPGPRGNGGGNHYQNFIDCVRSRNADDLAAPIEEGYLSAALVHLANASYRLGRTLQIDPQTGQVKGDDEANRLLRDGDRGYRAPYVVPEQV